MGRSDGAPHDSARITPVRPVTGRAVIQADATTTPHRCRGERASFSTSLNPGYNPRPPGTEELDMIARPVPALAAFCLLAFAPVLAEEGMWMPRQVPDLAGQLADKGYKVDTKSFSNLAGSPMGAVVSL